MASSTMTVIKRVVKVDPEDGGLAGQFSVHVGVGVGTAPGLLTSPALMGIISARPRIEAASSFRIVSLQGLIVFCL